VLLKAILKKLILVKKTVKQVGWADPLPMLSLRLQLPLRCVWITPFVLQLFGTVGLVGYLSFKNGEKAVNSLADDLIESISQDVRHHLSSYLAIPHQVNQVNADAIRLKLLNPQDLSTSGRYFWHQMHTYDVSYIGLYLPTGAAIGAGSYDGKQVTIDQADPFRPDFLENGRTYLTDVQGNRTQVKMVSTWDVLNDSSYSDTVKAKKPLWTRIYSFYDGKNLPYIAASASHPIYDRDRNLIAVVNTDIHLLKLSTFLQQMGVQRSGQVFIMERNGKLIANSAPEPPFRIVNQEIQRLRATESPNPMVHCVADQIQRDFPSLDKIQTTQSLKVSVKGQQHYVRIKPWRDDYGLDWLVVTSVPENAFMAEIHASNQITFLLCGVALAGATAIGIVTASWIAKPIDRLNRASQAVAMGNLTPTVSPSKIREFDRLATSFNNMAEQLRASFAALSQSNLDLEERVLERTHTLKKTLEELQSAQAHLIQSEKMSSLGQLVAGVAHEINNPVNFIHGNLMYVQQYTQDLLRFVQLYEQYHPIPSPEIQAELEHLDLKFVKDDLPKVVSSMQIGTDRICGIVLSLRNFSRLDEADVQRIDLHEGINSTLLILQHRLRIYPHQAEIQIVKIFEELPLVECYAGPLNQVWMNILANAIDALEEWHSQRSQSARPEPHSQITIRTRLIGENWVEVAIEDNGPGIPKVVQPRIFDPFFTTKPIGKGTGMGMAISYQIVTQKHGGQIECRSQVGQGTEFRVQIPLRQSGDRSTIPLATGSAG
jgi:signal transduction histidine kinase